MNIEDFEDIIYEKEENGICTLTFNRPERRNALSFVTFLEIETALKDMEQDNDAHVLIITGCEEGNAFSSGGYFNMKNLMNIDPTIKQQLDLEDIAIKKLCMTFWNFSKPVIAAINGLAVGAGITMPLSCCDLIYMAEDAWAGFFFIKRAIVPEFGMSFLLPLLIGFQRAKEILYLGDKIPAQKMDELGLINGVVAHDELIDHCRKVAERLIPPQGASLSIKLMKKLIHDFFRDIVSQTLDKENIVLRSSFKTQDFRESVKSLGEKRDPVFTGRENRMIQDILKQPFDLERERKRPRYTK
jgi:2-(1,2-epoxy-1,2-dihydrophenyl)acetyl-CoA isomerase